jgi:hypothetical protein
MVFSVLLLNLSSLGYRDLLRSMLAFLGMMFNVSYSSLSICSTISSTFYYGLGYVYLNKYLELILYLFDVCDDRLLLLPENRVLGTVVQELGSNGLRWEGLA